MQIPSGIIYLEIWFRDDRLLCQMAWKWKQIEFWKIFAVF